MEVEIKKIDGKVYLRKEAILRWVEMNLVVPFEGHMKSENKDLVKYHDKITGYNRTKFNKLQGIVEELEKSLT